MPLPAAEHARVQAATRSLRNAMARRRLRLHRQAKAWCEWMGATVTPWRDPSGKLRYKVKVREFAEVAEPTLAGAVDLLDDTIARWCDSPAAKGPKGTKLDRLRAKRAAWEEARGGD